MSANPAESLRSHRGGELIFTRDILRPYYLSRMSVGLYEGVMTKLKKQPNDITTTDDKIGESDLNYRNEALATLYETALLATTYGGGWVTREYVIPKIVGRADEAVQDPLEKDYRDLLSYEDPEIATFALTGGDSYSFPGVPSIVMVREGVVQEPRIILKILLNNYYRAQGRGIRGEAENTLVVSTLDPDKLVLYDPADLQTKDGQQEHKVLVSDASSIIKTRDGRSPVLCLRERYNVIADEDFTVEQTIDGYYIMFRDQDGNYKMLFLRERARRPHLHIYKQRPIEDILQEISKRIALGKSIDDIPTVIHIRIDAKKDPDIIAQIEQASYRFQETQPRRRDLEATNLQIAAAMAILKHSMEAASNI